MSALEQEVAKLLAPLRKLHETAMNDERLAQAKLDTAREQRREIEKMLRAVDPTFHNPYAKNGKRQHKGTGVEGYGFTEERLATTVEWLTENAEMLNAMNDGDGFVASRASADFDIPGVRKSQSTLSKMLLVLHDRGVVRLNKVGGGVRGGRAKLYKVVV